MSRIQELKRNLSLALQDSKWERALGVLEKLISLEEKQPAYHNQTGDVLLKMGRRAEAIESFLRGVKAYRDLGMYPNGGALCKKVLRLEPDHREAIWILGELKTRQGFLADGADKILDAMRLFGEDPSTTKEMILELLENALQLQGGNLDILEHAAAVYTRLGEAEPARAALLRIADIEERDGNRQRAEKLRQDAEIAPPAPPPLDLGSLPEAPRPVQPAAETPPATEVEAPAAPMATESAEPMAEFCAEPAIEAAAEPVAGSWAEPTIEAPAELAASEETRLNPPHPETSAPTPAEYLSELDEPADSPSPPDALGEGRENQNPGEEDAPVGEALSQTPESSTFDENMDVQPGWAEELPSADELRPHGEEEAPVEQAAPADGGPGRVERAAEAPEDLRSLLEAVDEADTQTDSEQLVSRYAISDPEPLDVALRHAVEETMKEGTVSDWPQSLPEASRPDATEDPPCESESLAPEPSVEELAAGSGETVVAETPAATVADAMEITTPGVDSLRTLEELPPWQPAAVESTQDQLPESREDAKEPEVHQGSGSDAVDQPDAVAGEEAGESAAAVRDDSPAVPDLELPSRAEDEAAEMLAAAESNAKDDWLGLSEDAAPTEIPPASGSKLQPFEIKDISASSKPSKGSSNGDGKRDSLSNISVGLMGSERELRTDQVEQVFAEFRHRMADQLGNLAPEERYQLGISYMEMGLIEEALEEFEPCLEHPTFGHQAREWMARCTLQLDRPAEVVRLLEQTLEAEPYPRKTSVELYYLLGQAYEFLDQRDRALDAFNKVYQLDTEFRDVQSRLEKLTSAG